MTDVLFPQLSDQDPDGEGVLATWFVDDGATVAGGKLIAEVMVGKVTSEVNAPVPGDPPEGQGGRRRPAGNRHRDDLLGRVSELTGGAGRIHRESRDTP